MPVQSDQLDDRQAVFNPKRHAGIVIAAAMTRALGCVIKTDSEPQPRNGARHAHRSQ
jgi:hypothetical protein